MTPVVTAVLLLCGIGLLLGVGLGLAAHFLAVKEDEKAKALLACLPGANCGACGFSGCAGYAKALSESAGLRNNLCPVGGEQTAEAIAAILGTKAGKTVKKTARVRCRGMESCRVRLADYEGVSTCRAASALYNGGSGCAYGCLGLGDCVSACEKNAIKIRQGIAVIDESLCVACGKCEGACPKKLIAVVPVKTATVLCRNPEKGPATKAVCTTGCLGCRLCEKACSTSAITVTGGVAQVDPERCTGCGACADACKFGVIRMTP